MTKVKTVYIMDYYKASLDKFPNFHKSGSVAGMKKRYYGQNALLVRCGEFIYKVDAHVYNNIAH